MTREEFIQILDKKGYTYELVGDKIVIFSGDFNNDIKLGALESIPSDVVFRNKGEVYLLSLYSIPPGTIFNNGASVYFEYMLESISSSVVFNNRLYIYLKFFNGGNMNAWDGNIKGINSKSLFNLMIKQGVFER
jgi:hypothetical protein